MDGTKKQRSMIKQFQCAGCVCGSDPKTCPAYRFKAIPWGASTGFTCDGHVLGTRMLGVGSFALGLPKGFCRAGEDQSTREPVNRMTIRLWERGQRPTWDKFNVAAWGMEQGGFTFVRTYSPRNNLTRVDVCEDLPLEQVAPLYDVGSFIEEID